MELLLILTSVFDFCYCSGQGRAASPGRQSKGTQRYHLTNRKYAGSKVRFPQAQDFIGKLPAILARARKKFRQPCPKV